MVEILVLKSPIQRTSQRVKRTSAARVMASFGRSFARSCGRFALLVHACTMIMVHACAIIMVHARTMIIVHACTMIIVHACTMIIVHACTMIIVHVST